MLSHISKHGLLRWLVLSLFLGLVACAGSSQKPDVVVEKPAEVLDKPVLTPEQQAAWDAALGLMTQGQHEAARQAFEHLLLAQPRLAGARVNLAILDELKGDLAAAEANYQKALELNPANHIALMHLGLLHQQQGRFKEAEVAFLKAQAVNGEFPAVQYNLAVLYELYLQDYARAVKHYQRYVELGAGEDKALVERRIKLLERKS